MRTKNDRQDNTNNDQHDAETGRRAIPELSEDFDFMEAWDEEDLSDLIGYHSNGFD